MPDPVIITRPRAQAGQLAQQVTALGREAVIFPLLEIEPLPDTAPLQAALGELETYAMVAFVSPNAIDAAFAHLDRWPAGVAIGIMGEGSRTALAAHGVTEANATIYKPRDPLRTDSQTLLEVLDLAALRGKKVLILRGETGREFLADALREAGVEVVQVASYRRQAPRLDERLRQQLLSLLERPNDWIMTSSEALRILLRLAEESAGAEGVAKLQRQRMIISHVRIAEAARELGFQQVTLTGSGDERLLAALQS
jgi:uroporphyrinogen-III synthase